MTLDLKTLTDFKKALGEPGCTVTVERNDWLTKRTEPPKPSYWQPRTVRKLQTNAVAFTIPGQSEPSWLYFPKAASIRCEGDTVTICLNHDASFRECLVYRVAVPANKAENAQPEARG